MCRVRCVSLGKYLRHYYIIPIHYVVRTEWWVMFVYTSRAHPRCEVCALRDGSSWQSASAQSRWRVTVAKSVAQAFVGCAGNGR